MKDMASKAFDSLKDAAATPVRWIVNVVYTNGIQKTWNGIAGAIGLDNLKLPDAHFATGGVMPGYTPGRDVMLAQVSGGEAIMRPEFTRALGANNINALNAAARSGGVQGVRGLLGYSLGGIIGGAWTGGVEAVFVGYALSLCFDAAFGKTFLILALGELFGGFACGLGFCRFGFLVCEFAGEDTVKFLLRVVS